MKKDYLFIDHQYDVWHMSKSVTKKLTKKPKVSIVGSSTHGSSPFQTTCGGPTQTCNGDATVLVDKWKSIIHHISMQCSSMGQ